MTESTSGTCPLVVTRVYTVTDLCLNVSAAITQVINVDDNTAPAITGTIALLPLKVVSQPMPLQPRPPLPPLKHWE